MICICGRLTSLQGVSEHVVLLVCRCGAVPPFVAELPLTLLNALPRAIRHGRNGVGVALADLPAHKWAHMHTQGIGAAGSEGHVGSGTPSRAEGRR